MALDPAKGARYTEPVHDYEEDDFIEKIYKLTEWDEYWTNPMMDEWTTWEKDRSCNSY